MLTGKFNSCVLYRSRGSRVLVNPSRGVMKLARTLYIKHLYILYIHIMNLCKYVYETVRINNCVNMQIMYTNLCKYL